jgi:hypothetical protein
MVSPRRSFSVAAALSLSGIGGSALPTRQAHIEAKTTIATARDRPDLHALFDQCVPTTPDTCTVGMYLSYDQSIMMGLVFDHSCNLLGAVSGMQWDWPTTLSPPVLNLPNSLEMTPHWDGAPSEFRYEGHRYQDGWTQSFWDDYAEWYEWLYFSCEK